MYCFPMFPHLWVSTYLASLKEALFSFSVYTTLRFLSVAKSPWSYQHTNNNREWFKTKKPSKNIKLSCLNCFHTQCWKVIIWYFQKWHNLVIIIFLHCCVAPGFFSAIIVSSNFPNRQKFGWKSCLHWSQVTDFHWPQWAWNSPGHNLEKEYL